MKKIKQGGVLGRNLKHAQKIKMIGIGLIAFVITLFSISFVSVNGHGSIVGGVSVAAIGGIAFHRDPAPDGGGGGETEEQKALNKIKSEFQTVIDAKLSGTVKKSDYDALEARLKSLLDLDLPGMKLAEFKAEVIKLQGEVKAIKEKPASQEEKGLTWGAQFAKAVEEGKEKYAGFAKRKSKEQFEMVLKTGTMTEGNNLPGTITPYYIPQAQVIPGVISVPRNKPIMLENCDTASVSTPHLVWVNEYNPTGDAGFTAEGALKSVADFSLKAEDSTARKITINFKVSEEMLEDIPYMQSEIETKGRIRLALKLDAGILSGNGTPPNLNGFINLVPGFTSTAMNGSVVDPNQYDAIKAAITQIIGVSDNFYPNTLMLNPIDKFKMEHIKGTTEEYVVQKLALLAGQLFDQKIVVSNQIPAGYFFVGDFTKAHVRIYKDINMLMGWENDDFTKNLRTIIMEARIHSYMSNNEVGAFVYDQYATVETAIAKVSL